LQFWDFLTGDLHANFERVSWVPVFNTMNSSDGVSILDFKASFDSGVGGVFTSARLPQRAKSVPSLGNRPHSIFCIVNVAVRQENSEI